MKTEIVTPGIFENFPEIICVVSTRIGGVSDKPYDLNLSFKVGDDRDNVRNNRKIFFGYLNIDESNLVYQHQTHSDNTVYVDKSGVINNNDAVYTDKENLFLCLTVADCLPVFLYHPAGIIAAVHSGWRGSYKRTVYKTVVKLAGHFRLNAADIIAYIGPGLSVENFEIGEEVKGLFRKDVIELRNGKYYLDNKLENILQLKEAGILKENIEVSEYCTYKEVNLFHSYRRDREKSGRMIGLIGMRRKDHRSNIIRQ